MTHNEPYLVTMSHNKPYLVTMTHNEAYLVTMTHNEPYLVIMSHNEPYLVTMTHNKSYLIVIVPHLVTIVTHCGSSRVLVCPVKSKFYHYTMILFMFLKFIRTAFTKRWRK